MIIKSDKLPNISKRISLEKRIYILSIVAEPLLFFILSDQFTTGFNITLSRLLQVAFLMLLGARLCLSSSRLYFLRAPLQLNYRYGYFLVILTFSTIFNILGTDAYQGALSSDAASVVTEFADLIRNSAIRPLLELIGAIYYFIYFAILPSYILKTRLEVEYLFTTISKVFLIFIVLGFLDVLSNVLGVDLIPRHLVDSGWVDVGPRFHSFAGEPRDAFPYILFGIFIIYLRSALFGLPAVSTKWVVAIICALVLTQSASGLLGLLIGTFLLFVFYVKITIHRIVNLVLLAAALIGGVALAVIFSTRLMDYWVVLINVVAYLEAGTDLPPLLFVQRSNIFPIWVFYKQILALDFFQILFGNGIGSSSVVNNSFGGFGELANPNSQLVRLIYEAGGIGSVMYVLAFIGPMRIFIKRLPLKCSPGRLMILFVLIIGTTLGHKTNIGLITLGIISALIFNNIGDWKGVKGRAA